MALTILNLAKRINYAAPAYAIGGLQHLRAELHGKRVATSKIFSKATVFAPYYAFHHGGRTELQFNIGREIRDDGEWWRHGVAFSFEPGQTLPDPEALFPKVERFNEWLSENGRKVRHFKMWHFDGDVDSGDYRPRKIPSDLVRRGAFVFLGARVRKRFVNVDRILQDFDRLFPLYEYIESMTERAARSVTVTEVPESTSTTDRTSYRPQEGDYRNVIERQIYDRRGQPQFRKALRKRYEDRCLVTGCDICDLLEAAHIKPYRGENDNDPENGLLLRADIHTLFDLDLLGIEPEDLRIELAPALARDANYGKLAGRMLRCVSERRPSRTALRLRYNQFRDTNHLT